jgi:hypothetical protein
VPSGPNWTSPPTIPIKKIISNIRLYHKWRKNLHHDSVAVMLYIRTRQVLGSSLGWDIGYPQVFFIFLSTSREMSEQNIDQANSIQPSAIERIKQTSPPKMEDLDPTGLSLFLLLVGLTTCLFTHARGAVLHIRYKELFCVIWIWRFEVRTSVHNSIKV